MTDTLQAINNIDKLAVLESKEKWDVLMQAFLSSLDVKEKFLIVDARMPDVKAEYEAQPVAA